MKDWVKPFLAARLARLLDEIDADEEWRRLKFNHLEHSFAHERGAQGIWWQLTDELNCHFGIGGLEGDQDWFMSVFGSVLSDLPQEVFQKLCEMKNVFYTFTPNPGAEVKHFLLDEDMSVENWDRIIVVTFPYESVVMPPQGARGRIVHELVHVYLHTDKSCSNNAMEEEADKVAAEWGFGEEIKAMREYDAE